MAIKTSVASMQLGDRIVCEYICPTSGQVGSFLNLGTSTATPLAIAGSTTASGSFYFIYVGTDENGNLELVADRNLQHSVSWDTLNSVGVCGNEGVQLNYDPTTSLIAAYAFDTLFGTTVFNRFGSAYNGTKNGTTLVSGATSGTKALSFNGTTDYVSFATPVIPLGAKTIRFKMKHNGNPPAITGNEYFILGNSWDNTKYGMTINVNTSGKIVVALFNGTGVNFTLTSNTAVCDNAWHDVMFTWDGTTTSSNVKLYIDNLSSPDVTGTATGLESVQSLLNFYIGTQPGNVTISETRRYRGIIDQLEIYESVVASTTSAFTAPTNFKYYLKLPSGGVSSTDVSNDWDMYLVNGNANGLINVGHTTVWNWSIASWTSSVSTTTAASRVCRGGASVSTRAEVATSTVVSSYGFRPVLIVEKGTESFAATNVKTDFSTAQIGDLVPCSYAASANTAGTFSRFGSAVGKFIPQSGITTPSLTNGNVFNWVKVEKGLFVADRVLQTDVSWNVLNAAKFIFGNKMVEKDLTDDLSTSAFTASSSYSSSYGADKAFNNVFNESNAGWQTASGTVSNVWLKVTFDSAKSICSIKYQSDASSNIRPIQNFRIEASNDNTNWTTQYTGVGSSVLGAYNFVSFTPTGSFLHWRIYIVDTYSGLNAFTGLSEVEMSDKSFITIRAITGGVGYNSVTNTISTNSNKTGAFPSHNEFDTHLLSSTLNNTVTAADNTLWNYKNNASWTSDTPYTSLSTSLNRVIRGKTRTVSFTGTTSKITFTKQTYTNIYSVEAIVSTTSTKSSSSFYGECPMNICSNSVEADVLVSFGVNNGYLQIHIYNSVSTTFNKLSNSKINDGNEHHVCVTVNYNTKNIKFYIDGVLDASHVFTENVFSTEARFNLIGNGYNTADFFNGTIRHVRFWSSELSATEVASYAFKDIDSSTTGLSRYWKMQESTGTTATDAMSTAVNGTYAGVTFDYKDSTTQLVAVDSGTTTTSLSGFRPVLEYYE